MLPAFLLAIVGGLTACETGIREQSSADASRAVLDREVEEAFRLGGLQAPEEETFSVEPALAVDRDGLLYVLHRDRGEVAVFDGSGAFVRWIGGGRGEGPGELTSAGRIGFVEDTLWVRNRTPPRISRFHRDGSHLGTDRVQVQAEYRTTAGVQGISGYLRGGRAWMEPDGFITSPGGGAAPFILGDREMEARVAVFSWRAERGRLAGTRFAPLPEPPFYHVAPDGSGILVAEWSEARPDELSLRVISPDGADRGSWTLAFPSTPIPQRVRDSLVEAGRERVGEVRENVIELGISEDLAPSIPSAGEVREVAYLPRHYPPIRDVRFGLDGTMWLQRSEGLDEGPWVALDPEGVPLFQVRLPPGVTLRQASTEAIWATRTDELDIPYVIGYALRSR